ncbi:hypothetical protein QR680_004956 [Steinernema hermaphroditum]|uniref:EGF-like domain-containing protein n=1 Tax=Steinernema hermaphroditum TaxID=289476 RepID=A0AA39HRF4_9BILA|nr:hypothetical protein QR680_004956 [Steinernema hermaphroditum]
MRLLLAPLLLLLLFLLRSVFGVVETVPAVRVVRFQVDYPDADVSLVNKHNKWTTILRNSVLASLRFINKHWLICGGTELEKRTNDCGKLQVSGEVVDNNHYRVNMTFITERDPIRNSKVDATSTVFGVLQIGLKGGIFQYTNALRALGKPAQTLGFDEAFFCYRGSTLYQQDRCRLCEAGQYHNETLERCALCPKGTYQSHSGRGYCISCGYSYTTQDVGARSIDQCILECQPGYRIDRKANQCVPCGFHHFQPTKGQSSCLRCPEGTVATTTTATSRSECMTSCGAGLRRKEGATGVCEPCPKGTYKSERDLSCQSCPEAVTTTVTGATDIKQCNLPNCEPGSYLNHRQRKCELCKIGEFQGSRGATSCKSCKAGFTTKTTGATGEAECVSTNQCTNGEHQCHWLAQCFDLPDVEGKMNYGCKCHPGFVGNGFTCVDVCFNFCENGGKCVKNSTGQAKCVCQRGFVGRRCEVFDS